MTMSLMWMCTITVTSVLLLQATATENVALKGIASQINTAYNGPANYAIDGNDDSIYGHKSCSHTGKKTNAWWKVDLEETYSISQVVITNRQDCCSERIDGAVVLIGDNSDLSQNVQCGDQIDWNANTYEEKITFDCQLSGRYVAVQLKDHNNYLHLCEVEVFGKKHHESTPCSLNWKY
ncbi:fucolectin-like [Saccoglossus kowalevskii]|uniref:Fucolectin-5-like n=1 Tax=Saccoglossus kowalevskii TaxID=10224 RepID=A0ABM0LXJ6_SACKO|nr:PREDICTED: fucolectin-5-like [Saccoglossus kowalevskii]